MVYFTLYIFIDIIPVSTAEMFS